MKAIIFVYLFNIISVITLAQESNKGYIETDINTKISVGYHSLKTINHQTGLNIKVYEFSKFRNPVYGVGFNLNYRLSTHFSTGVGFEFNIVKFDNHPVIKYEYIDKVLFPLYIRARYQKEINTNWLLLSDVKMGYQLSDYRYENTKYGFNFKESGGLLLGFDVGLGRNLVRYTPIIKIGYELIQFSHEDSLLGWVKSSGLSYFDKIYYKAYYNLLKVSLSVKM